MRFVRSLLIASASLTLASPARAVMVYNNAAGNTTDPGTGGWQYTGSFAGSSGVAIAPNAFLATQHQGGNVGDTFTLNGTPYTTTAVTNIAGSDLRVWQVSGTLNSYTALYHANPTGQAANIVGFGIHDLGAAVDVISGAGANGWQWGSLSGVKSWGNNTIDFIGTTTSGYHVVVFNFSPNANEGTLGAFDSGGGVFVNDGGVWKVAGINYGVESEYSTTGTGNPPSDPSPDPNAFRGAIYDGAGLFLWNGSAWQAAPAGPQQALAHDVNFYYNDIVAAVPEPAALGLLAAAPLLLMRRRR